MGRRKAPRTPRRAIELQWPAGGIERSTAYQKQQPFTCQDAENVRTRGAIEGRERGGSRPGLEQSHYTRLDTTEGVNLINQTNVVATNQIQLWEDEFTGEALGNQWSTAAHLTAAPGILPSDLADASDTTVEVGVTRTVYVPSLLHTADYYVGIYIVPYLAEHWGTYRIQTAMDNTTPILTTDGTFTTLTMTGTAGVVSGSINDYASTTLKTVTAFDQNLTNDSKAMAGWFIVHVSGTAIKAYWRGDLLNGTDHTVTNAAASTKERMGFSMQATAAGGICLVDAFRAQYTEDSKAEQFRQYFFAAAGGNVKYEDYTGNMTAVNGSLTIASNDQIISAERGGNLYIADHDAPIDSGTDGKRGTTTTTFDDAGGQDWTTLSIDTDDHVLVITESTGTDVINGVYQISSVASGEITTSTACNTGAGTDTCTYRIERGPKQIVGSTQTMSLMVASGGVLPTSCRIVVRYRDRLVWARDPQNPHQWYMSKLGSPLDYSYQRTSTTPTTAISGTEANAGLIGDRITAVAPYQDDFLVWGCENSLWMLEGDPQFAGQHRNVSETVGILSQTSWDWGPSGELWFMSRDGLYVMPGARSDVKSVSHEKMPRELKSIATNDFYVNVTWNMIERELHIYITPKSAVGDVRHWVYVPAQNAFWKYNLTNTHDPVMTFMRKSHVAGETGLILGGRDGYMRKYNDKAEEDDGNTFTSYVEFGPIQLGNTMRQGVLKKLVGVFGKDGGDVDWSVRVGDSARDAIDNGTNVASGNWNLDGRQRNALCRARGSAAVVKITDGEDNRLWALESLVAEIGIAGMSRTP